MSITINTVVVVVVVVEIVIKSTLVIDGLPVSQANINTTISQRLHGYNLNLHNLHV